MGHKQSLQITTQQTDDGEETKVENAESNGHVISNLDLTDAVNIDVTLQTNCKSAPVTLTNNTKPSSGPDKANGFHPDTSTAVSLQESPDQGTVVQTSTPVKEEAPKKAENKFFKSMFKKKAEAKDPDVKGDCPDEAQITTVAQTETQKSEPPDIKGRAQAENKPQGDPPNPTAAEVAEDILQADATDPEEKSVMNFFKSLKKVSPTKTTKEATATPDVSKEQSQKGTPAPPAANVQDASKVLPPPPPAPPKMESKVELAVKKEEPAGAAETTAMAAGAKEQEGPSKAKAKDSPFSKLFRPKALLGKVVSKVKAATVSGAGAPGKTSAASVVKEEAQPVEVQVDASKTSTLEASAKPEQPLTPKPEEQKPEKKSSSFANLLKPKVTETKREGPASPASAEASSGAKIKEEQKPAAPSAAVPAPDTKSVGSADNPSPSVPRKLEKRNSIQLFFKNLGQKRHSDAGVQTETSAPEKAK